VTGRTQGAARVISQDGAGRRNQEEGGKKYHNKLVEAIQNMQFGRSLASLTKLFKSRALFWNICFVIR